MCVYHLRPILLSVCTHQHRNGCRHQHTDAANPTTKIALATTAATVVGTSTACHVVVKRGGGGGGVEGAATAAHRCVGDQCSDGIRADAALGFGGARDGATCTCLACCGHPATATAATATAAAAAAAN